MGRRKVAMTGAERVRRFRELQGVTKQDEVQALQQKVAELEAELERSRNHSGKSPRSSRRQAEDLTPEEVAEFTREPARTNDENEQILRVLVQLLVMVDPKYQQKFNEHVISNSEPFGGIFVPTCSHRAYFPQVEEAIWSEFPGPFHDMKACSGTASSRSTSRCNV